MNIHKKPLPLGISAFEELIGDGYVYIDKTKTMYELTKTGRRYFFSRPRRFGKSLLLSTFKEFFSGNKELFKDTWAGRESAHDWQEYPVLSFDLSGVDSASPARLESGLCMQLEAMGRKYGVDLSLGQYPVEKLRLLVETLAQRNKVVILVDEYDSPILKHVVTDRELAHKLRDVLNTFFTGIKSVNDLVRFVFFTGVSKFAKTSVFSGLNHLNDISLEPMAATLCGYTEEEVRTNLTPHIQDLGEAFNMPFETVMDEMRTWYNGYRFSRDPSKVYNPYSIFFYLDRKIRGNFWFGTATTKFLADIIMEKFEQFQALSSFNIHGESLGAFDIDKIPLANLLFQTGYLTIENYAPDTQTYKLAYPNNEVRESFEECLLGDFLSLDRTTIDLYQARLKTAIESQDIDAFCAVLQGLLSCIPYNLHIKKEAYYHTFFHIIGTLLGLDVQSEVATSVGRIDTIVQTKAAIFIFEFKLEKNPAEALAQIKAKRYYEPYLADNKKIYLIGLSFVFEEEKRLEYVWEQL